MSDNKVNDSMLEKKCTRMCGSINFNTLKHDDFIGIESTLQSIISCLMGNDSIEQYYVIYHGDTDTCHYHFAILLKRQVRIKTMITYISNFLGINSLAINCKNCTSISSQVRYFTHYEDKTKGQYSLDDIHSNMDKQYVKLLYESDDDTFDFHRLVDIIFQCGNEIQVMEKLGLALFHKYRYEIRIMLDNSSFVAQYYMKNHQHE